MENLKSLVRLVNKHKVKNIEVIGTETSRANTKLNQLYQGIASGEITCDNEGLALLYEAKNDDQNNHWAYKKLKSRLDEKLRNTLFFIDQHEPRFNKTRVAYYNSYKNLAAFKILIGRGARKAAIPLGERTLRQAKKFGITQVVAELAADLRNHFAVNEGNLKKFEYYHLIAEDYRELREAELKTEFYYAFLMVRVTGKRSSDPILAQKAKQFANEIDEIKQGLSQLSFRFLHLYFMIKALHFEIDNQLDSLIEVCREALTDFTDEKRKVPNASKFTFAFKLLQAYTQTNQPVKAEKAAEDCLQLVPEGSANWFHVQYAKVLLYFHWDKFDLAHAGYLEAAQHRNFDQQYQMALERWRIIEAYIQYLLLEGKIQLDHSLGPTKSFRVQRFVNDMIAFSKDKSGYNVDLIVLQILLRLQKEEYDEIVENMDTWQKYATRYLNRRQSKRSKYFLKMLLCLPKARFHLERVQKKAKKYFKKLKAIPQNAADPEIIPYETLWRFVLDSLDNRLH